MLAHEKRAVIDWVDPRYRIVIGNCHRHGIARARRKVRRRVHERHGESFARLLQRVIDDEDVAGLARFAGAESKPRARDGVVPFLRRDTVGSVAFDR